MHFPPMYLLGNSYEINIKVSQSAIHISDSFVSFLKIFFLAILF